RVINEMDTRSRVRESSSAIIPIPRFACCSNLNVDPRIISVFLALSTIKKQIMQEMDKFLAICWDRLGVQSPEQQRLSTDQPQNESPNHHHHHSSSNNSSGSNANRGNSNSVASVFTPGRCVPVLVFVIERVPVVVPWFDSGATESQIVEQLRQHVLKKSVDALQTRLRYVFRACKLIQSLDAPAGVFDARQLFVLPGPSSTPFVHVIPYFTGQLNLLQTDYALSSPATTLTTSMHSSNDVNGGDAVLDPAEEVLLRQKIKSAPNKKHGGGGSQGSKGQFSRNSQREKTAHVGATLLSSQATIDKKTQFNNTFNLFGIPALRDVYDAAVHIRDNSLAAGTSREDTAVVTSTTPSVSLGSLYLDYSEPLLKQFVYGWLKNLSTTGGYGNAVGKRNVGNVDLPTLKQWLAGSLGVCEALGMGSFASPIIMRDQTDMTGSTDDTDSGVVDQSQASGEDQPLNTKLSKSSANLGSGGGRRSGGKRYSQRCVNMVQKKIQDYVLTDEVMEEL
ncbi:hypothetical protein BX616_006710, partial [Lobosporangium transversale]